MPPTSSLYRLPRGGVALTKGAPLTGLPKALSGKEQRFVVLAVRGSHDGLPNTLGIRSVQTSSTSSTPSPSATTPTPPLAVSTSASPSALSLTVTKVSPASRAQASVDNTRSLHSSTQRPRPTLAGEPLIHPAAVSEPSTATHGAEETMVPAPPSIPGAATSLSKFSTTHILRSLMTTTISSSPTLLPPSLTVMSFLANSKTPLLDPDTNPLLRWGLKTTFYRHFCAGENAAEIARTAKELRNLGFSGIILGYAREVIVPKTGGATAVTSTEEYAKCIADEIIPWATGNIETIRMAQKGDFVALKFTGAGRLSVAALARQEAPPPEVAAAIDSICTFATLRGVRLLFDAEQFSLQPGIDKWAIMYMKRYNTDPKNAFVYNTYQCYLKSTPGNLSNHLAEAQKDGFTLGAKLVRGAYMGVDARELFWDAKEETDACYNAMATGLLRRQWGGMLQGHGQFPDAGLCLATHNAESVRLARDIAKEGTKTDLSIAQLQGMADEVSCSILADQGSDITTGAQRAKAYKYLAWGSTGECMKYLLRRAQENKDAVQRTKDTRDAMKTELVRRVKGYFGLA